MPHKGEDVRKVKVLQLITHLGFGGASDNTLLTVEQLSRAHYEVHLAAGQDYLDWVEQGRERADAFFLFPDLHRDPQPVADVRVLNQLTTFIKENNYDIVHTHNATAGILGRIAARRARVPIIIHSMHLLSWQDAIPLGASPWRKAAAAAKRQLYLQLERYAASLSDALIMVCESNRQEAIAARLAPPQKISTIYSGIDQTRFKVGVERAKKCRELGLDPSRPIVGMIGRLSAQKAPLDFVRAAKDVLRDKPDAQFIMVGDGPLAAEVTQAVGDERRIKVLGYRDDVPELYAILDVFALSSLWEGLGRALTEAMIMGVPVAATAVNGIPELVNHQQTGLLSPPHHPAQLAENIVWLLDHPEEARRMGQRGQALVVPNFDAKQMVHSIEALYERLLAEKGRDTLFLDLKRSALG
jgi:glycosyltransferase involved in cell wall biosynthesis